MTHDFEKSWTDRPYCEGTSKGYDLAHILSYTQTRARATAFDNTRIRRKIYESSQGWNLISSFSQKHWNDLVQDLDAVLINPEKTNPRDK